MLIPKEERRNVKRRELLLLLPVYEINSETMLGALGDISTNGLMLFSNAPITIRQTYTVNLLNKDLAHLLHQPLSCEQFVFKIESRWRAMLKPELYKTGFRLLEATPASLEMITELVRQLWSQRSIGNSFIDIKISIEDMYDLSELQAVSDYVRELAGVVAVSLEKENARMMTIQYHPEQTSCNELLQTMKANHIMVRLVRV
jgi:hypothetical protein